VPEHDSGPNLDDSTLDPAELLRRYDGSLRARMPDVLPPGASVTRDGPLVRLVGLDGGGFVTYRDLDGLAGAELDALIARQRDFFAARGELVEWKLHGHDQPADLAERLVAAGFAPEAEETVVIGLAAPLAAAPHTLAPGVRLREVTARTDLDRIVAMEEAVWGVDKSHLGDGLEKEIATDPDGTTIVVAEVDDEGGDPGVVCAGWVRYVRGTPFATLWGGSTLPGWRGRGIYRSVVRHRAVLALARGYTHLQVDASSESRPILARHGFVAVTTTTPYVYTPD
jgi:hypothetical protein